MVLIAENGEFSTNKLSCKINKTNNIHLAAQGTRLEDCHLGGPERRAAKRAGPSVLGDGVRLRTGTVDDERQAT